MFKKLKHIWNCKRLFFEKKKIIIKMAIKKHKNGRFNVL